ncbi:hypothetical protein VTK56DRAFT_9526 [Thermocarpiscus australiensis]
MPNPNPYLAPCQGRLMLSPSGQSWQNCSIYNFLVAKSNCSRFPVFGSRTSSTPMYSARSHARALLFSRAKRPVIAQQHRYATNRIKNDMLQAESEVAKYLLDSNIWGGPGRRRNKQVDRYRVNIVSEKLCDDVLNYIKPTLTRHEGCDLIDVFPGTGVWSRKLNDLLKPRSHLLLEPDEAFYKPLLEPLLQRPGTTLLPESGIVWEQLNKVLNPAHLPHQVERKFDLSETPQRNDTLLVSINLSLYPRKRFRTFESLTQLVLFQLISSIRPMSLFQKYGLVRMLVWVQDNEKHSILPRTVQQRRKMAVEAELDTEHVCEIAGADVGDLAGQKGNSFRRDQSIDMESTARVLRRMRKRGFVTTPGRESQGIRDVLEFGGESIVAGENAVRVGRPFLAELEKLEFDYANGEFAQGSELHKRLKNLQYHLRWSVKRGSRVHDLLAERDAAIQAYAAAGSDDALLAQAKQQGQAWSDKLSSLEKSLRAECLLHRDNLHVLHQDPPVLNWDRRYVEPLVVRPTEFFPNVPCVLLDIQPKAAAPVLRERGPGSNRSGDTFDLILRALVQHSTTPISKALDGIYPGATDGVCPLCPSLWDPAQGGSPLPGWGELTSRSLSERQLVEIVAGWMKWPFRPSYAELVARIVDDAGEDVESEAVLSNAHPVEVL